MERWLLAVGVVVVIAAILKFVYWAVCMWVDALSIYDPSDEDW